MANIPAGPVGVKIAASLPPARSSASTAYEAGEHKIRRKQLRGTYSYLRSVLGIDEQPRHGISHITKKSRKYDVRCDKGAEKLEKDVADK